MKKEKYKSDKEKRMGYLEIIISLSMNSSIIMLRLWRLSSSLNCIADPLFSGQYEFLSRLAIPFINNKLRLFMLCVYSYFKSKLYRKTK